jgi:hypothetical protein
LAVFGRTQRDNRPYLIVVLPNGSRSFIPTEWTDLEPSGRTPAEPKHGTNLGLLEDLLRARTVVDALLGRLAKLADEPDKPIKEEEHSGATISQLSRYSRPRDVRVGRVGQRSTKGSPGSHSSTNHQDSPTKTEGEP